MDGSVREGGEVPADGGSVGGTDAGPVGGIDAGPGGAVDAGPIAFPSNAGVIDVSAPPYNARADDGMDDSTAIQQALTDNPSGNTIFYFGPGTFEISATLRPALSSGVVKRNIFQGAGRDLTTLKLRDNLGLTGAVIDFLRNFFATRSET
jgi:hypothetical protein